MGNVKVIVFTVSSIKLKRNNDFKKFWTNNKYILYTYEMYVKIADINKDKAQAVSNSDNFFKSLYSSHSALKKR